MKLFGLQIEASRDSRGHETPELKNRVPAILALLPGPASGNARFRRPDSAEIVSRSGKRSIYLLNQQCILPLPDRRHDKIPENSGSSDNKFPLLFVL